MSIIVIVGVGIIIVIWLYIFLSGLWKWLLGTPTGEGTETATELDDEIRETYERKLQEKKTTRKRLHDWQAEPMEVTIREGKKARGPMDPLLERWDILKSITRYDTITKADFDLSEAWIRTAEAVGMIAETDTPGVYEVKKQHIRKFQGMEAEEPAFEPEFVDIDEQLRERMIKRGIRSIGLIGFTPQGPMLTYAVGRTPQTDRLANPRRASVVQSTLYEVDEGDTAVLDTGELTLVAGKKVWRDQTQLIYGDLGKLWQESEAKDTIKAVLNHFNGVNGKASFKLAVVNALDGEPSETLIERTAEEQREAEEAFERQGVTIERRTEEPEASEEPEEPQGVEPSAEENAEDHTESEEMDIADVPAPPHMEEMEEEGEEERETAPYEAFRSHLRWLQTKEESGEDVTLGDFDAFIAEDLGRSMRTARRKRNELLERGYIMKEHEFQEWHVHLTEKGRGSIDPESE